tara:strand:+ start:1152 stop:1514 length:363 start_codon:yes stop_codon:yes gene_type:complete
MAEGFGKKILHKFNVESAGTMPEKINPNAIKAMKNVAIDISNYKSKKIEYSELARFDYVITLCGDAKDRCPVINANRHIHWDIPDPVKFKGTSDQISEQFSKVRDRICEKIKSLKNEIIS